MDTGIKHSHVLLVVLFSLIFLIRTILLATGKKGALTTVTAKTRIPSRIIDVLILLSGGYLAMKTGFQPVAIVKFICLLALIPVGIIAFKKEKPGLALIGMLIIVYMFSAALTGSPLLKSHQSQVEDTVKDIQSQNPGLSEIEAKGKALYAVHCAVCHGDDGKKGFQGAKDLTQSVMIDSELKSLISQGKGVMPSFSGKVEGADMDAVVAYLLAMRAPK